VSDAEADVGQLRRRNNSEAARDAVRHFDAGHDNRIHDGHHQHQDEQGIPDQDVDVHIDDDKYGGCNEHDGDDVDVGHQLDDNHQGDEFHHYRSEWYADSGRHTFNYVFAYSDTRAAIVVNDQTPQHSLRYADGDGGATADNYPSPAASVRDRANSNNQLTTLYGYCAYSVSDDVVESGEL
jgi:hypothetical protein